MAAWCRRSPRGPIWRFLPELVRARDGARRARLSRELGGVAASAGPGLIGGLIVGSQFAKGIAIAHGAALRRGEPSGGARADRAPAGPGARAAPPSPTCCCWSPAGIANASRWRASGATGGSAARWTTRRARRSTRWRNCSAWAGPAGRRWSGWRRTATRARYAFPRPLLGRPGCDFSFSGLKTAVAQEVARHGAGALPAQVAADIAASFQRAVAEVLADRAAHAMAMMRERTPKRGCWWWPAASRRMARSARRWRRRPRRTGSCWWRRRCGSARTTR